MIKLFKNCEVIVFDSKKINSQNWAIAREQGKTWLEIYLEDVTIRKRLESAMPKKIIGKRYGLPVE